MRLETLTVHTGRPVEPGTGAVTPSITLATTFERAADGSAYGRPDRVYDGVAQAAAAFLASRDALDTA